MNQYEFFQDNHNDFFFPTFIRGVSEDNFFTDFSTKPQNKEHFILSDEQSIFGENKNHPTTIKSTKKAKDQTKKESNKQKKDYKKNICGYITKKIVREFMAPNYKNKVEELCKKYGCQYGQCHSFYDKKIERITGPTHLDMLLNATKQDSRIQKCFKEFFIWFLRHRYLRYLMSEGKMSNKELYIDYKNKTLLYLGSMQQKLESLANFTESQSKETSSIF